MPDTENSYFTPGQGVIDAAQLTMFIEYCEKRTGLAFPLQRDFYEFSVEHYARFWSLFLIWSGIIYEGSDQPACEGSEVESARFFPGVRLNYVENLLSDKHGSDDAPAVISHGFDGSPTQLLRDELRDRVVAEAQALTDLGVKPGDVVAAVSANTVELLTASLAVMSIGAILATASTDLGTPALLARFRQLSPRLLLVGLLESQRVSTESAPTRISELVSGLPTLSAVVGLDAEEMPANLTVPALRLTELVGSVDGESREESFSWPRFPFDHPLVILFSSGTTGPPKCIVHTAGGVLLEHTKEHVLHGDLRSSDVLFFHTSPAWMMWNWQLSALLTGAAIVLFSAPVSHPATLWSVVEAAGVTVFGTSPPYLQLCEDAGFVPSRTYPLRRLRLVMSTGSVLHDRQFDWVRRHVGELPVHSISGGTDIIGCFVLGSPLLAVHRGESQCRSLGLDVRAVHVDPVTGVGELVCCRPFPSRPLGFYGDVDGGRFHETYFAANPGVWTHGDLIEITERGSARMHGRSDAVLNIGGTRIGPAEIYAVLDGLAEIKAAMAVEQAGTFAGGRSRIVLLVVLHRPGSLDVSFEHRIREALARQASSAHVPELIVEVEDLPLTFSGKRSERAVRDVLAGVDVTNIGSIKNPESLTAIKKVVEAADDRLRTAAAAAPPTGSDDTIGVLRSIFADVLGVEHVRPDDSFFDLGGTSLSMAYVGQDVRRRLAYDIPLSAMFSSPTPRSLAAFLEASSLDVSDTLVLLKPGAPGERPIFALHALRGEVLVYLQLASLLPGDRPVYGIRARGLDHRQEVDHAVEDMAESSIDSIRLVQASGPYTLLGYSFGGLIAYEIARRLSASGDEVDMVGLLDAYVGSRALPRRERWFFVLVQRPFQWVRWLMTHPGDIADLASRARRALAMKVRRTSLGVSRTRTSPRQQAIATVALRELKRYQPLPYAGNVVLFRAEDRLPSYSEPAVIFGRATQDRLTVEAVPGGHFEMVTAPHVSELARRVAGAMTAASAAASARRPG